MTDVFQIREAALPLSIPNSIPVVGGATFGAHHLLVLYDATTKTEIAELDGLATTAAGAVVPVGTHFSDKLVVYLIDPKNIQNDPAGNPIPVYYSSSEPQTVLLSGSQSVVQSFWNAGLSAQGSINAKDLLYPPYGIFQSTIINSNSVASTLIAAMDLREPLWIPGENLVQGTIGAPGTFHLILDPNQLGSIKNQFNLPNLLSSTPSSVQSSETSGGDGTLIDVSNFSTDTGSVYESSAFIPAPNTIDKITYTTYISAPQIQTTYNGDSRSQGWNSLQIVEAAANAIAFNLRGAFSAAFSNTGPGDPNAFTSNPLAGFGLVAGTQIGELIGGGNPLLQVAGGTLLGALGALLQRNVGSDLGTTLANLGNITAQQFGEQLAGSFGSVASGIIS